MDIIIIMVHKLLYSKYLACKVSSRFNLNNYYIFTAIRAIARIGAYLLQFPSHREVATIFIIIFIGYDSAKN